ncbi:MAG: leucine--tRNA ligase [Holosporales bacterium]|jgi:leucyl-tRNA synthetase|nr:leucine--tRNA ligase [Holosporales bacterium]
MSKSVYDFKVIEKKWSGVFSSYCISNSQIINNAEKKYYVLEMLPYPSGKLHMGHIRNYTIGDVLARYKAMAGFSVIHPMGWDSFGMPAENAALKSGGHPRIWTEFNIETMKEQLKTFGFMYDWPREISTCSRAYYAQEQKLFLDLLKRGLIYRKKAYVNWDPVDNTVLANEQVIDGRGWRSGAIIEKKLLEQWFVRITDYAEDLLSGLKDYEGNWPDKVLKMQENWIGRSEGATINFKITDSDDVIPIYTTRPDTLFGASFVAISPDHEISLKLAKNNSEITNFLSECKKIATNEEALAKAEKEGFKTHLEVDHFLVPGKTLPVYIANFVLIDYGTGAIFGCPAHDDRDFAFATKYNLPILQIIKPTEGGTELPYAGDGILVNSGFFDGLTTQEAKAAMIDHIEKIGIGTRQVNYKLRDWLISRQRYWGCPIPIIHCPKCGMVPSELTIFLPDDIEIDGSGNPLEKHPTWKHVKCLRCGGDALRDTDTLDTFFESSWYYLRYLCPDFDDPIEKEIESAAMPVDICIGGIEHAVLHLLYARFFMLALRDMGYVKAKIPFVKILAQGMVYHKSYKNSEGEWIQPDEIETSPDGKMFDKSGKEVFEFSMEKMSKSKKNTINPQSIIESYGVDAARLFIVSDSPPEKDFDWNTDALEGSWRFLNRVWKTFNEIFGEDSKASGNEKSLIKTTHVALKKIANSYETVSLNKSVAFIREFFNAIEDGLTSESIESLRFAFKNFIKAISPITPHICHEMWKATGETPSILQESAWPEISEALATVNEITIAVQVNGKLRGTFETEKGTDETALIQRAREILGSYIDESTIKKIVAVKDRVVNVVCQ